MSIQKPGLPKGTRDFGPSEMAKRNYILDTIRDTFKLFGFQQLETPALENLSTLTGKYGDEGDQLLFKVLDSGEYFEKTKTKLTANAGSLLREFYSDLLEYLKNGNFDSKIVEKEIIEYLSLFKEKSISYRYTAYLSDSTIDLLSKFNKRDQKEISQFIIEELKHMRDGDTSSENYSYKDLAINNIIDRFDDPSLKNFEDIVFNESSKNLTSYFSEKGLRYDLTVPFARYVVMNRNDISFPFKRFQIQPVWRADRPQKGRYREFYQCDADVVGTDSLICEAEILIMIKRVFAALGLNDYTVKINNRKILTGIAEVIGESGKEHDLCMAIDKLDKIGWDKVKEELSQRGFDDESISKLSPIVNKQQNTNKNTLEFYSGFLALSEIGLKGLEELMEVFGLLDALGESQEFIRVDPMLARGLSYYTGAIFEVKVNNVSIGSVSGGGRYDNLTGVFGLPDVSGVGFSFGVDRIYDVLEELSLFDSVVHSSSKVMVAYFGEAEKLYGLKVVQELRRRNIPAEIYPEAAKIKKQFTYADKKNIPFVIIIGSEEIKTGKLTLKNMASGSQNAMDLEHIVDQLLKPTLLLEEG